MKVGSVGARKQQFPLFKQGNYLFEGNTIRLKKIGKMSGELSERHVLVRRFWSVFVASRSPLRHCGGGADIGEVQPSIRPSSPVERVH
jgi:hypothetical protein